MYLALPEMDAKFLVIRAEHFGHVPSFGSSIAVRVLTGRCGTSNITRFVVLNYLRIVGFQFTAQRVHALGVTVTIEKQGPW